MNSWKDLLSVEFWWRRRGNIALFAGLIFLAFGVTSLLNPWQGASRWALGISVGGAGLVALTPSGRLFLGALILLPVSAVGFLKILEIVKVDMMIDMPRAAVLAAIIVGWIIIVAVTMSALAKDDERW